MRRKWKLLPLLGTLFLIVGCVDLGMIPQTQVRTEVEYAKTLSQVPEYKNEPYVVINDNEPGFLEEDMSTEAYEFYSDLDTAGRCGVVHAILGKELMPTEISM